MRTGPSRIASFVALIVAAHTVAPIASAAPKKDAKKDAPQEDPAVEAARAAFKQGLELEKEGKYEEALAKFEETAKVKTTPQVRFHIALCNERLGRYKVAIEGYKAAAKQAEDESTAPEVLKVAPDLAQKLEAKLAKLTVRFEGDPADALLVDGVAVPIDAAKDLLLDPGPHVVLATKGEEKRREELKLGEGESKVVVVDFRPPVEVPDYSHPAEKPKDKAEVPPPPVDDFATKRTVGFALAGVGSASLLAAGVFLLVRNGAVSDLEAQCNGFKCPPSAQGALDRAQTFTTLSRVALGISIVSLGASAYFLLSGKKPSEPAKTGSVAPWSPAGSIGVGLEGAF